MKKIKVMIIDDSALVREILSRGLAADPAIEVVATAAHPYIARDKIVQCRPDVLTLDVEMPRMDGVDFLRKLMAQHPLPVVMVSALTRRGGSITMEALEAGAVDFVTKPGLDVARGLNAMLSELRHKVKVAAAANIKAYQSRPESNAAEKRLSVPRTALAESTDQVIAIGASTGGTKAIQQMIRDFPANMPGVVVVQHMPPGFTRHFAVSLNQVSRLEVSEAKSGDRVMSGRVLIAPGGMHMSVRRSGGHYLVDCEAGPPVNGHCPSVDVLFHSVAKSAGSNAIGVILTGMGQDGAQGLAAMRRAGARTLAQDEASSVVYGMPKAAYECGGAERLEPLSHMAGAVINYLHERRT